ncbi:MAG: energy transducer TonB [Proteobacteria bacterium]|nr:energy transducer TonB [Pseudomonadota bacterium]
MSTPSDALPAVNPPRISEGQRLSATFLLSLAVHAVLLLGVGFAISKAAPVVPTLDVILTQVQTPLTPKQADFLAQAANQGGGEHDKTTRPTDPQVGDTPSPQEGVAARELQAQAPTLQPPPETRVVTTHDSPLATATASDTSPRGDRPLPPGERRVDIDMSEARLAAEIDEQTRQYAKRPKTKYVSASTREYAYAGYLRQWVDRVQRVGNLNYPEEARRRRLQGSVMIGIGIRRDGSIESLQLVRSSGNRILDDAALRIARLAEPYPPLPKTSDNLDVLNVVRTWEFLPGGEIVDR